MLTRFALAVAIALISAGCVSEPAAQTHSDTQHPPQNGASGDATPTPTPPPDASEATAQVRPTGAKLELLSRSTWRDSQGFFNVAGEFQNYGPQNASMVQVHAKFYDAHGHEVGTAKGGALRPITPMGEKSPFRVSLKDERHEIARVELTTTSHPTDDGVAGAGLLQVHGDTNLTRVNELNYLLTGEIANRASATAQRVTIVATFYDKDGTVLAAATGGTDPVDVPAREFAKFRVPLFREEVPIASYELHVHAMRLE